MDYMGIDHHKQYSHITLMEEKGKKLRAGKVANYRRELEKFLKGLNLPDRDKELLCALIKTFTHLQERRDETNGLVEKLYQEMPEARLIRSVPGYGIFLSVLVAVEIAEIGRFSKASQFLSYAGVIPSVHSSGGRSYHGKIVKEGNRWLRWAVVEAVYPGLKAELDEEGAGWP